jgi:hypothetical protein
MARTTNQTKLVVLAAAAAAATLACGPDRTMLVVRVQSNLSVPDALDTVRLVVRHAGKEIQSLPFPLTGGTRTLPLEIGLLSPSGGGTDVGITVSALLARNVVVSEEAITSFIKGKSLVLDMYLAAECVAFDCKDPNKTCTVGQVCIDRQRPAEKLPVFVPHPAPNDAGGDRVDAKDGPSGADARDGAAAGADGGGVAGTGGVTPTDAGDAMSDVKADAMDGPVEVAPEVPTCVPKAEDCFNGLDDDCDTKSDCADTDCVPTAVCVPRPSGTVGTTVDGTGACPAGFGAAITQLGGGLTSATTCSGCQCGAPGTTTCTADLYTQLSQASCGSNTGGKYVYTISTDDAEPCPIPDTNTTNVYGARLTPWTVQTTGCPASGTPVKPIAVWGKNTKFCGAEKLNANAGNGCATGQVCMPRGAAGRSCVLLDGAGSCPAGAAADTLYTTFTDGRSCAACSCAKSASCDNLYVKFGSDYSCGVDYGHIKGGMATCATQTFGIYVPGYELVGTPNPPTCTPTSAVSGVATPTGARTICCLP